MEGLFWRERDLKDGVEFVESGFDSINNCGHMKIGEDGVVRNKPRSVKDIAEYLKLEHLDAS